MRTTVVTRSTPLAFVIAIVLFAAAVHDSRAGPGAQPEYALKAALLYKLMKFVSWPPAAEDSADEAPFRLCILGEDPFAEAIDSLAGRTVRARPIVIERLALDGATRHCQLLFVRHPGAAPALNQLAQLPILTVSDAENFAVRGGMIEISRQRNRLGFRINAAAARAAGLIIAAPLLELATVVE